MEVGFFGTIIIGGIAGWLASKVMGRDASMGIIWNVVAGVVGAMVAGWLGGGLINLGNAWLNYLVLGFVGAIIVLGVLNLVQRGKVR